MPLDNCRCWPRPHLISFIDEVLLSLHKYFWHMSVCIDDCNFDHMPPTRCAGPANVGRENSCYETIVISDVPKLVESLKPPIFSMRFLSRLTYQLSNVPSCRSTFISTWRLVAPQSAYTFSVRLTWKHSEKIANAYAYSLLGHSTETLKLG